MSKSYEWDEYLTVGSLKEILSKLPDDLPVYYQHIDDAYMWKGGGWVDNAVRTRDSHAHTVTNAEKWTDNWLHRAFWASQRTTIDGVEVLEITAHY